MSRRDVRKKEIQSIRQEGKQAFLDGKSVGSLPLRHRNNMNHGHWIDGYWEGYRENEASKNSEDSE